MASHTTVQLHKPLFRFLYFLGLSPIKMIPLITSCMECQERIRDYQIKVQSEKYKIPSSQIPELSVDWSTYSSAHANNTLNQYEFSKAQATSLCCSRSSQIYEISDLRNVKKWFWIVMTYVYLQAVFSGVQIVRTLYSKSSTPSTIVAAFCWFCYSLSTCLVYLVHVLRAKPINDFLLRWQIMEQSIFSEYYLSKKSKSSTSYLDSDFYKRQRLGGRLFSGTVIVSFSLMVFNITLHPRFPMYLYSLLPADKTLCWFHGVSSIVGLVTVGIFILSEGQVEILFPAFARSVNHCLTILMDQTEHIKFHQTNCPTFSQSIKDNLGKVLKQYEQLEELVKDFNAIFAWPIVIYKAVIMMRMCGYSYIILKHPSTSGYLGYLIFPYALLILVSKIGIFLSAAGFVIHNTSMFLRVWKKRVMMLNSNQDLEILMLERRLKGLSPFGIACGNFYFIQRHTLLTFYSITLTYLIIMLQL